MRMKTLVTGPAVSLDMSTAGAGKWLNDADPDASKHLTTQCAEEVVKYMRSNPDVELGCLIKRCSEDEFEVIPFRNGDPTAVTIQMFDREDFLLMDDLYRAGTLWGWFHSHPHGRPYPSWTDLTKHNMTANMGIYGGAVNTVSIFSTRELQWLLDQRKASMTKSAIMRLDKGIKENGQ